MKLIGIYSIENLDTNKKYIGSSIDIVQRWQIHIDRLNSNKHENENLQRCFNSLNKDISKFKFEVLELVEDVNILKDKEQLYINKFNDNIYNVNLVRNLTKVKEYRLSKSEQQLSLKFINFIRNLKYPIVFTSIYNHNLTKILDCEVEDILEVIECLSKKDFRSNAVYVDLDRESLLLMDLNRKKEIELLEQKKIEIDYSDYEEIQLIL